MDQSCIQDSSYKCILTLAESQEAIVSRDGLLHIISSVTGLQHDEKVRSIRA